MIQMGGDTGDAVTGGANAAGDQFDGYPDGVARGLAGDGHDRVSGRTILVEARGKPALQAAGIEPETPLGEPHCLPELVRTEPPGSSTSTIV